MGYADQLSHEIESSLATLLLQIVFILALCRVVGYAMVPLKQPPVSGEILAGIIMGPSVMGQSKLFADFMFPPRNAVLLKGISDLGVTMFMFILGLEFSPSEMVKSLRKTWMIGACGIILPFGLGAASASYLYDTCGMANEEHQVGIIAFILFVGAAMSFTAFPVLARILTANDAMTAQIGLVSMGVASVDDVLAWTVLAIATSYTGGGRPQDGAWGILISIAWVVLLLIVIRPLLRKIQIAITENNFIVVVFMGMCVSAWFTQVLGLHAFFGAFCFGIAVPKDDRVFILKFIDQLEVVVVNFFVPLFFANTGLRTDLTKLHSSVGPVLLVWALATVGKIVPAFFLGRCRGYSWRFSFQLASLMNARGLIDLIALEMARDVKAFNVQVYSVFVVMALATTFMAGPMFHFSYRKSTDPPLPIIVTTIAEIKSPRSHVSGEGSLVNPDLEEAGIPDNFKCSEIPVEEQMDLTAGSYGYLFQRTLYRQQQQSERTSVMDVFGLHLRQSNHPENASLNMHTNMHGSMHTTDQELAARKLATPRFDSLRSTRTYPAPKKQFPTTAQAKVDTRHCSVPKQPPALAEQLLQHQQSAPKSVDCTLTSSPDISTPIPVISPRSQPTPPTPRFDPINSSLTIVSESTQPRDPPSVSSPSRKQNAGPTSPRSTSRDNAQLE